MERKAYPSDMSDDEWAFVAPLTYLAFAWLMLKNFIHWMAHVL
jgi:hypothetical protein